MSNGILLHNITGWNAIIFVVVILTSIFRRAIEVYVSKNVKFADAVMSYWGLERGMSVVYTYDEKDFRRIAGLTVKKP